MKELRRYDESIAAKVALMPKSWDVFFRVCTAFGSVLLLGPLTFVIALLLLPDLTITPVYSTNWEYSGLLVVGLLPLAQLIKALTRRRRPDTIYVRKMRFKHFSFPSGHSYASLLVYGFLAYLAGSWPFYVLAGALAFLVGLSRLYLGAHFPSDVLGGWLLGGAMLAVVIIYASQA